MEITSVIEDREREREKQIAIIEDGLHRCMLQAFHALY